MRRSLVAACLSVLALWATYAHAAGANAAVRIPSEDAKASASRIVVQYTKSPTSVGNLGRITKTIPRGKRIIHIGNSSQSARDLADYMAEAARLLRWKVDWIEAEPTLEGQRAALQQAIDRNPDGISVAGMEPDTFGDLYVLAGQRGIVVICSACQGQPLGGLKDTSIAGPKDIDLAGVLIAAYTVNAIPGPPKVLMFGLPAYSILNRFDAAYQKTLIQLSPSASFAFAEIDFAQGIPAQVTSAYAASGGASFITSDLGDFFIGVAPALAASGASPGATPMIGGLTAGTDALATLRAGTTNAWTGYSLPIVSYRVIDAFARYFTRTAFANAALPTQIITPQNVGRVVLSSTGNYLGVPDYRRQFMRIWGLKGLRDTLRCCGR